MTPPSTGGSALPGLHASGQASAGPFEIAVKNLPWTLDQEGLEKAFREAGTIESRPQPTAGCTPLLGCRFERVGTRKARSRLNTKAGRDALRDASIRKSQTVRVAGVTLAVLRSCRLLTDSEGWSRGMAYACREAAEQTDRSRTDVLR